MSQQHLAEAERLDNLLSRPLLSAFERWQLEHYRDRILDDGVCLTPRQVQVLDALAADLILREEREAQ